MSQTQAVELDPLIPGADELRTRLIRNLRESEILQALIEVRAKQERRAKPAREVTSPAATG